MPILIKYLDSDTEKELQALYALQASIVKLDQPPSKCCLCAGDLNADSVRESCLCEGGVEDVLFLTFMYTTDERKHHTEVSACPHMFGQRPDLTGCSCQQPCRRKDKPC